MSSALASRAVRRHTWQALAISILLHALVLLALRDLFQLPSIELEFQLPSQVEFGVVDGEDQPPPPATAEPEKIETPSPRRASSRPAPPKAPEKHAAAEPTAPAERPLPAALAAAGRAAKLAPKGTQIALRLDLDRIRKHALADEASALLLALPDVRALLDGSGVDPVRDLSRLLLASPDLRREHVVLAGRYVGADSVPREAVARLAEQQGAAAPWQRHGGIATAAWHNADVTPRVLALLGPGLFVITRPDDLPRVLAIAHTAPAVRSEHAPAADDLVHMDERELLNLAVENARSFVRGARDQLAPLRLTLSIREQTSDSPQLELAASAQYPDSAQADSALQYWDKLRQRYASHPLVALMSLDRLLDALKLSRKHSELAAEVTIPLRQSRLLLRFVRDSIRGPEPPPDLGQAEPAP